jgi:tellurite resistance protein
MVSSAPTGTTGSPAPPVSRLPLRITANLFGVSFGLSGIAQTWAIAGKLDHAAAWPADVLWALAAAAWLLTLIAYVGDVARRHRLTPELNDSTLGPFTSLVFVVMMLLGVGLEPHAVVAAKVVFLIGLVGTVALGGWLTGQWISVDMDLDKWHPGYFLPTTAGGLVAAASSAEFGWRSLAYLMFGYGLVCWLVLGSILLLRLFTRPALPPGLVPSMAIELAPPVVAGNAWFAMNGNRLDTVALLLAGYAILMVLVQVRLAPSYLRTPFGIGTWSFAFAYSSAFTVGVRWLTVEHVDHRFGIAYALVSVVTLASATLAIRTVVALVQGSFVPRSALDRSRAR